VVLTEAERRALEALDASAEAEIVRLLVDLVRMPSVTGTDAEAELQRKQATLLAAEGLDVDFWKLDLDALSADPGYPGTEAVRTEGYGMVAATDAGVPALVLQGHIDVVPPGDRDTWAVDPFAGTVSAGVLHGRGACDMKAGVAANLAVVRAIRRSGLRLEQPLAVHTVVSEEDGGLGAFATVRRGHTGDAAVITEPTSGRVVTAAAGALTFAITVPGRAAHGSTRYEGVSAFDAYLPLHRALLELERSRNASVPALFGDNPLPYAISIGCVHAGDWSSSVPDLLTAHGRYGVRLGEDMASARAQFEAAVGAVAAADPWLRDHPPVVTWSGGQFGSGTTPSDHPFVAEVQDAVRDSRAGSAAELGAVPYGSDLRIYAAAGMPTLHYGPGDVRLAHSAREQVRLEEVFAVARALTLLAVRRCGAH
jgi:acetylornithine deacetylase